MFFVISKLFSVVAQPLTLAFLFGMFGFILLIAGRRVMAGVSVFAAMLILGVSSYTSAGFMMIAPLENRFARPEIAPESVDYIVVLGGGFQGEISGARGNTELNLAGDRFVEALRLALIYPEARIAVTGGFGSLMQVGETDAVIGKRFYEGFGIAAERLILEGESRNTAENASLIKEELNLTGGETVLLVTSAFHMPRSVGLFRAADIDVIPWPTDYRSAGNEGLSFDIANPVENITVTTVAMREWLGLLAYNLTGQIADIFPGPDQASN